MSILYILLLIFIFLLFLKLKDLKDEREIRKAGKVGEKTASHTLSKYLNESDHLLQNVSLNFEGRKTEIDMLIVNQNGIFIIEVKNYNGVIYGNEEDDKWQKIKTTDAGNSYEKEINNPIHQVKREVYILSKYLKAHHIYNWITGYVYFVQGNSPVQSEYILNKASELNSIIHKKNDEPLSEKKINEIIQLLK